MLYMHAIGVKEARDYVRIVTNWMRCSRPIFFNCDRRDYIYLCMYV